MKTLVTTCLTLALALASPCAKAQPSPVASAASEKALAGAVRDLCGKKVALLGEGPTHGDGNTEQFKAALVDRLIRQCGFTVIFFEASHYEFLNLERVRKSGERLGEDQIAAAVGGLWRFDVEFQPLLPVLADGFNAGTLHLGGLDDQLGGVGQDFANRQLGENLTAGMAPDRRSACREAIHHRIYQDYPRETPYSANDKAALLLCLAQAGQTTRDPEQKQMLHSLSRWIGRDLLGDAEMYRERDRSMFENFRWLSARLPRSAKIIVWGATMHLAKDASATSYFPASGNLGSRVHAVYGKAAYALGFSALEGAYRVGRRNQQQLPAAPAGSLEAQVIAGADADHDAVYVGPTRLAKFGRISAAAFRHEYQEIDWSRVLDGIVVFRRERPAQSMR
ncbi:erythromycin esterase family protein [Caulobacter segnis]